MAISRTETLLFAMLGLLALLLAGCSGGFRAGGDGGDEASGGVNVTDGNDEDNDAPGPAAGVLLGALGLVGVLYRRNW